MSIHVATSDLNLQEFAANYWVQNGAPRHKMNIGLPLYGRSFTLSDPSKSGINAPAKGGGGKAGKYTREKGYLAYYEVRSQINSIQFSSVQFSSIQFNST